MLWSPLYEWHGDRLELRARAALALGDGAQLHQVAARLDELARVSPSWTGDRRPCDSPSRR